MAFFLTACALIEISYADQPASMGEPSAAATGLAGRMTVMGRAMDLIIKTSRDSRLHAFA
jgi:hypothetical protein